jgi:dipeptidyl aminopeptidase/acylaminoacyl peptidase
MPEVNEMPTDTHDDIRILMEDMAEEMPQTGPVRPAVRRARRRLGLTSGLVAVLVAAVVIGSVAGIHVLARPVRPQPVGPPSGSPARIAVHHNGPIAAIRRGHVVLVNPETGSVSPMSGVLSNQVSGPFAWSADGTSLAYVGVNSVRILNTDSGVSRRIAPSCSCGLALSPDASTVALGRGASIELVNTSNGVTRTLTPGPRGISMLAWSPDGGSIVFVGHEPHGRFPVLDVIGVDGSALRTLVTGLGRHSLLSPTWSPNGRRIAFIRFGRGSSSGVHRIEVEMVRSQGGPTTRVAPAGRCVCLNYDPGISWSPDGTQFAVIRPINEGQAGLYVMNVDGSTQQLLAAASGGPAWRPVP